MTGAMKNPKTAVTIEDFDKIDIRVGRIMEIEDFPEALKPLYRLTIDFGPLGMKRSGAGLRPFYSKEELVGRLVVAVVNFPPRQIANFQSECLILGAITEHDEVVLLHPGKAVDLGAHIA
jgi:tRNA-binding protein